jgi:hypothetical protein
MRSPALAPADQSHRSPRPTQLPAAGTVSDAEWATTLWCAVAAAYLRGPVVVSHLIGARAKPERQRRREREQRKKEHLERGDTKTG